MSAVLHPNYPSMAATLNKETVCDCGRNTKKDSLMMKDGVVTCPQCRKEKS